MAKRQYSLNPIIDDVYKDTLYQPQLQNHFELVIRLNRDLDGGTDSTKIGTLQKYLNLAVTSFSLPTITTTPIDIPYGNTTIHIAGKTEFGGANSITCIDYIGADIERILYNWQNLVTNPETGQQGWAYNYKTDAEIIEYAPDGSSLSVWVLRGLWPSEINYGSLDKSSGDLKQIEVTLSYDLAYKKKDNLYDTPNGRGGAATPHDQNTNPADLAGVNMTWKKPSQYEHDYGNQINAEGNESGKPLDNQNTPGPLGAASANDGLGSD